MSVPEQRVLNAQQYAKVRGITMDELYDLIHQSKVAFYKPGKRHYFLWPAEEV